MPTGSTTSPQSHQAKPKCPSSLLRVEHFATLIDGTAQHPTMRLAGQAPTKPTAIRQIATDESLTSTSRGEHKLRSPLSAFGYQRDELQLQSLLLIRLLQFSERLLHNRDLQWS